MKITHCTITGADDNTNIKELIAIKKDFPFVEWAILFASEDRFGTERYPSKEWINEYNNSFLNCALHLCGQPLRDYLECKDVFNIAPNVARIQLNIGKVTKETQTQIMRKLISARQGMKLIVPIKKSTENFWTLGRTLSNVQFLFDSSGGRGVEPVGWPRPIAGVRCGYAGGLGPDNIKTQLEEIEVMVGDGYTWIDMESNVRTDGKLDMKKVVTCLEASSSYFGQ